MLLPADGLSCNRCCKISALCCSDKTPCRLVRRHASGTYDRHSPPSVPPWFWLYAQHCSHGVVFSCAWLFPPLLAHGFVNNDFINQFTRHLFHQLCGLLILPDEPDKPPDMSRGCFCLLQLLLNFRYLALKAVLFNRVFLHQGLVLLFGQQT